ncbi:MAG: TetR/AcrR family transcriptional regulator [Clostridia bacterium]|nr:TetR/AcrR family transcriptional regulator [Clostridia bacterium]
MSIKQAKIDYIISIASDLFLSEGIEKVTIKDITQKVGVGEATIYRYFSTKQNLVIYAAKTMADQIHTKYFDLSKATTGISKMEAFYNNFLKIYEEHPEYFRFISEFDSIIQADGALEQYEDTLLPYMQDYLDAYNLGLKDGTINKIDNIELFYLTSTHALMGICKKLTMDSVVLKQDSYGKQEVEMLIDIIIYKLKTE